MALREEFIKSGNWLFRWRSYLPLIFVGILVLGLKDLRYFGHGEADDKLWELFCLAVSFFGLGIRIFTIGYGPKGSSGRTTRKQKASTLTTTGFYSIVRHPLYLGNFFIWLGISLFVQSWWITIICILVFWLYYERIMFAEEEFLREKFGREFVEWADRTPAFIPKIKGWKRPSLAFSFRTVLRKEYSGFFGIIVTFTLLEIVGDLFATGKLALDLMWGLIFFPGCLIYLILRTLKKRTNILSVGGR